GELVDDLPAGAPVFLWVGGLGYWFDTDDRRYVRHRMLRTDLGSWMQLDPLWPGLVKRYRGRVAGPKLPSTAYPSSPSSFGDRTGLRPAHFIGGQESCCKKPVDCQNLCLREYLRDDLRECVRKCTKRFINPVCLSICLWEARNEFLSCGFCCILTQGDVNCVDEEGGHLGPCDYIGGV
ncbi:MAG: hypothetical protein H3C58_15745, partial [Fimbriimonadaceae bacterium]|nr:hypothetical protein [Fimbriimonadaceae bacterium]